METIKIIVKPRGNAIGNVIRISNEARNVLQKIVFDHDIEASVIVSALIIQGAEHLEFIPRDRRLQDGSVDSATKA